MSRYTIEPDELWPVMRYQKPRDEELGLEVPDHMINDLKLAYRSANLAETAIAQYLIDSDQWRREDTPEEWIID